MAEVAPSIFNKRATEKLRSPDDLDKFVRVTNPSVWVILGACIALLAGLLAWGVFGAVSTSVSTTGAVVKGEAMCLLGGEDAARVHIDDQASVGGERMKVAEVSKIPLSKSEASAILSSDYLVSTLMQDDWAYVVKFKGDVSELNENVPLTVNITVERVTPISLILNH